MTIAESSPSPTAPDDLSVRLDRLEAENARLRDTIEKDESSSARAPRGGVWRAIISSICIVLAAIIVPISVITGWVRAELVDEDKFVSTFAPLVHDPAVQAMIIDEATTAINKSVDFAAITNNLFDGVQSLGLPPRASAAIDLLRVPAVQGLESLVTTAVTRVVVSDAFSSVWQGALTASHRGLVAAATGGSSGGAISISDQGAVGIELGPIIDAVKQRLIAQGVGFASSIPTINRTIVIAQSDSLATVRVVYSTAVTVGFWLPFLALALFVTGILVARRRSTAVLGSGIGLAIGGAALAGGIVIGGTILGLNAPQLGVSSAALDAIYAQVIDAMQRTAIVIALIGVIIAVLAWSAGRWSGARATRRTIGAVNTSIRTSLAERGVDTGSFGAWMYAQRILVRIVLAVLLIGWLLLLRPLAAGDIALVLVVGLLVWWLAELVQKRPGEVVVADAAGSDAETVAAELVPAGLVVADSAAADASDSAAPAAAAGSVLVSADAVIVAADTVVVDPDSATAGAATAVDPAEADTAVIDPDSATEVIEPVEADTQTAGSATPAAGTTSKRPPRPRTPKP